MRAPPIGSQPECDHPPEKRSVTTFFHQRPPSRLHVTTFPQSADTDGEVVTGLSRCCAASAKCCRLKNCQATATAVRHVSIAAARSVRCVWADVRWRWTLNVL